MKDGTKRKRGSRFSGIAYTNEDDEIVRSGKSIDEIVAALGRSKSSVTGRRRTLGLPPFPSSRSFLVTSVYTAEEDAIILAGGKASDVASYIGRTTQAIYNRRRVLGVRVGSTEPKDDAIVSRIRDLMLEGRTFSAIATELGVTKNSIVGLAHRRLKHVPRAVQPAAPKVVREPKPPAPRIRRVSAVVPPVVAPVESVVVPFLTASGCRWPLWSSDASLDEKTVCGASKDGRGVYCAGHTALAYTPSVRRAA